MEKSLTQDYIKKQLKSSSELKIKIIAELTENITQMCELILSALMQGNKVLFCGNGGSAADAQHLAAEFINKYQFEREPMPGLALTTDTSVLTSIGNDSSFDYVFSKQVKGLGKKGDVLVALSTSGNSRNVIEACMVAKEMGILVVGLTGQTGGKMKDCVDCLINIPSMDTPQIQEGHITIGHIMCGIVEQHFFKNNI